MAIFYSPSTGGFYPDDVFERDSVPEDAVEITLDLRNDLLLGQIDGKIITPGPGGVPFLSDPAPLTAEQEMRLYEKAAQRHLDSAAADHGYDGINAAVSYADEPSVAKFQREGRAFREWRSLVWAYCYDRLAKFKAGEIEKPTIDQLIAGLPALTIPTS